MAVDAGVSIGDARPSRSSERVATQQLQQAKAVAASTANRSSSHVPKAEDTNGQEADSFRVSSKSRTRRSLSSQRGDAGGAAASPSQEENHETSVRNQERSRDKSRASKHARQQADLDNPKFVRSLKREINDKIEGLPREIRRRFGEIVWVKLSGYPFWPGLIMDPRKLPPSMQFVALKTIGTKFWMYFYGTHDFAGISYKNAVLWDDKTYPYREGYPQKDLKAPARKEQLAAAMDEADDVPVAAPAPKKKREKSSEKETAPPAATSSNAAAKPPKENRGVRRSKTPPKGVEKQELKAAAEQSAAKKSPVAAASRAQPAQRQQPQQPANAAKAPVVPPARTATSPPPTSTPAPAAKQAPVPPAPVPPAPVPTPSVAQAVVAPPRGGVVVPPVKNAAPTAQTTKAAPPPTKPAATAPPPAAKATTVPTNVKAVPVQTPTANIISPIKLTPVVKTVTTPVGSGGSAAPPAQVSGSKRKSPMTTTAPAPGVAQPQAAAPLPNLDKAKYTVGPLSVFADKLRELYAQASTTGNWSIMTMLSQLFNEKVLFRSDLERSGLASAIAEIRKSPNQHVVQTAKAIRVHLMYILKDDIPTAQESVNATRPQKRRKSDSGDSTNNEPETAAAVAGKEQEQRKSPVSQQPGPSAPATSPVPQGTAARNTPTILQQSQSSTNSKGSNRPETQQPAGSIRNAEQKRPLSVHLVKKGSSYVASPKVSPSSSLKQSPSSQPAGSTTSSRRPSSDNQQQRPPPTTSNPTPDGGIDFALSLIQKVRERAESQPIKLEPERDPSPPHSRRVSAGSAPTGPSNQRSRPSSASSTGSVKRQIPEEEMRPQSGGSGRAAAATVIPVVPAPAAPAVSAPSRTTTVSPRSVIIKTPPPQDVVDLVEIARPGQVAAFQPAVAARQQSAAAPQQQQQLQLQSMDPAIYQISNLPRRRNPALVIFNKDGTLIDFNSMWGGWVESQAWKLEASAKLPIRDLFYGAMGYDWTRRSVTRFGALSTLPKRELAKVAIDVLVSKGMPPVAAQRAVRDCWSYPDPVMTCRPLADVSDIFRTIKQMGIKIAIRTTDNRECTKETLAYLKLTDLVDDMVCGDDGLPAAPAPEQVWALCNRLGVGAYNTVMVGDTPSDMALGHNSACSLSVGVFGGASALDDLSKEADILISSLDKITRVLFQYGQQASQQ